MKTLSNKTAALLGITAGLTFLFAFFVGLNGHIHTVLVLFFLLIMVTAINLLLLKNKK